MMPFYNWCNWIVKNTFKLVRLGWIWIYIWERWWTRCIKCPSCGSQTSEFPNFYFCKQVPLNYNICGWRIFSRNYSCRCCCYDNVFIKSKTKKIHLQRGIWKNKITLFKGVTKSSMSLKLKKLIKQWGRWK